jgi:hypothetical protein
MPDLPLVARLQPINDRLLGLSSRFGVPQYSEVVLEYQNTLTVLDPKPKIMSLTSRDVVAFMTHQLQINKSDLWLEGISRVYDIEMLSQAKYILNAVQDAEGVWRGLKADCLFIDRNQLMTYKVLVSTFRAR